MTINNIIHIKTFFLIDIPYLVSTNKHQLSDKLNVIFMDKSNKGDGTLIKFSAVWTPNVHNDAMVEGEKCQWLSCLVSHQLIG